MGEVDEALRNLHSNVRARFDAERRVLSFDQYLSLVREHPYRHTRDAARYLKGALDCFGTYEVDRPWGRARRFRLFDLDFGEPTSEANGDVAKRRSDHLVGQEELQEALHRSLAGFEREGRTNRLLLLHGPNGSAKSTFAACLMRGLEAYSQRDEGALYRFSWVFPHTREGKGIGFGVVSDAPKPGESFALLPEDRIQVKIVSETREHPLLLLPLRERRRLLRALYADGGVEAQPPDLLYQGELGRKNKQIFEALLDAYRGDLGRVLAHVQVERFTISRRYRQGAVTIGPQMAVDAAERQITADRSLHLLPASLSALSLYESVGELVDGSAGVIEYSDLLKRPLDAWKYLLLAIENGEVSLNVGTLALNSVLVASSNELHLAAFREHPDYHSFRGRITPVRVPYLLDHVQERGIYDAQVLPQIRCHVAPHTTFVAAYWGVLTRLRPPRRDHYEDAALSRAAASLSPAEKAELYAHGTVPARMSEDEAKALRNGLPAVHDEYARTTPYEGMSGASPREIRSLLFDVAADVDGGCLTPLHVLEALASLCKRDDYDFLKQKPDSGYFDARGFVEIARTAWLDRVEDELRQASGLVDAQQYGELFERYVTHVSHWVKKEKVYNPVTGKTEEPDAELMERVERMLEVRGAAEFRGEILATIASYAIDHPDARVEYAKVFPHLLQQMESAYFAAKRGEMRRLLVDVLLLLEGGEELDPVRDADAKAALSRFLGAHGYVEASAKIALGALASARYAEG
ncbi:MAG: serine protein kinase PrkA [Polyangiales bacterium]